MTQDKQTPADRLALVESLLNDTHIALRKLEAVNERLAFRDGEIYAYRMVLDAFATMGFDIGEGVE